MQPNIDISIVIVNYNVKDFLSQCISSIHKSTTNLRYEIIVVDNASTDGSEVIFGEQSKSEDNFYYIYSKSNLGFGKANNLGFNEAKGKYTLILNPDTLLEPDTLQVMYDYMESNPDIGTSGCKVLNLDGTFQSACRRGFPTPWASFCKLFGLQRLFPKSKLFAKYNLSYLNEDDTNDIDALIGAFMFTRTDVLKQINGFDESFFMYGEDLDLCYRIKQAGYRVTYYPKTTITHFKGESSKRSTLNETKHFYDAMEIFARKHYGKSKLFFAFLRMGIKLRAFISYLKKHRKDVVFIIIDLIIVNLSLILSSFLRWREAFPFPDYAYPTVFIFLSIITFISMLFSGEYFEQNQTIRKSFFGLLSSLLILTFFTYFFRDFAFSRGILLMTISFSAVFITVTRILSSIIEKQKNVKEINRIVLVGWNENATKLIHNIKSSYNNSVIVGYISNKESATSDLDYLGEPDYIQKTINDKSITEVIVLDKTEFQFDDDTKFIRLKNDNLVHIFFANDYDNLVISKILTEVSGVNPEAKQRKLTQLRYKLLKRISDISISLLMLTIGLPLLIVKGNTNIFVKLLLGKLTFIGLFPETNSLSDKGKLGIIGLAQISEPQKLKEKMIAELNNHYLDNYSLSLDFDILFKYLFRR
ncbi:MAG: glycosyltransferase [Candidatus Kapaibacterium sp.]